MRTQEDLLRAFIDAKSTALHEFSGNMTRSLRELYKDAKLFAEELGIEWDESYFDDTDLDIIDEYGDNPFPR